MAAKENMRKIAFIVLMAFMLSPWVSPPVALVAGFLFVLFWGHPFSKYNAKATNWLLKISVVGLGFGMNVQHAITAGSEGFLLTIFSILTIFILGAILGRWLKIRKKTVHLVSSGTAICGGSAIAAISPAINAGDEDMSVSLAIVFALNSVALIIFPVIGHLLNMSQHEFGLWCAIAIHDTSSVVGAAAAYGKESLELATTVKLARALWIIPVALLSAFFFKSGKTKIKIPWFIGLFILAMLLNSYFGLSARLTGGITTASRSLLVLTLFLIGAGLDWKKMKSIGWKPLALGIILWFCIGISSLWVILRL